MIDAVRTYRTRSDINQYVNIMRDIIENAIDVIIFAVICFIFTPSDNSMKVDFYDKMERVIVETMEVDGSLGGYFTAGLTKTKEGRAMIRAGIKASYEIEINDWWVVKTISIRESDSNDDYKRVGWGLFGFTIFSDDELSKFL